MKCEIGLRVVNYINEMQSSKVIHHWDSYTQRRNTKNVASRWLQVGWCSTTTVNKKLSVLAARFLGSECLDQVAAHLPSIEKKVEVKVPLNLFLGRDRGGTCAREIQLQRGSRNTWKTKVCRWGWGKKRREERKEGRKEGGWNHKTHLYYIIFKKKNTYIDSIFMYTIKKKNKLDYIKNN